MNEKLLFKLGSKIDIAGSSDCTFKSCDGIASTSSYPAVYWQTPSPTVPATSAPLFPAPLD